MTDERLSRRELIARAGATGIAVAGVAGVAAWWHARPGWPRPSKAVVLPSFAADPRTGAPDMVIARGADPKRLIEAALEEMGGIERFIAKGDVVVIKPNAAFARPVWQGATTHPDVLGAVVAACRRAGAAEVRVTDNPIHAPEGCFRKTGLGRAVEDAGGKVVLPQKSDFGPVSLPGTVLDGWPILLGPLEGATKVIGIAPVKDHNLARASMTLKNWYGLLGGARNRLHQRMDETIAALAAMVRPTFSVLDGTRVMVRNGPTGGSPEDIVDGDVLAISTDGVALDAFGASLLSLTAGDLAYLGLAGERGLGTVDYRSLNLREISG